MQCYCENSRCSHGENSCTTEHNQTQFQLQFLAGDPVCHDCITTMRETHPEWVIVAV